MDRYQDYVIKDGVFVGKFEEMYQKFDDPWHQRENLLSFYSRALTPVTLMQYNLKNVVEMGCGLGAVADYLSRAVPECAITGMDISETAVAKARKFYPDINFVWGGGYWHSARSRIRNLMQLFSLKLCGTFWRTWTVLSKIYPKILRESW